MVCHSLAHHLFVLINYLPNLSLFDGKDAAQETYQ